MKTRSSLLILSFLLFISCSTDHYENVTNIVVPEGFRVEKLLAPDASGMGSWVSLAHVADNRFVASDQYGKIYWLDVPTIGSKDSVTVTVLEVSIGKAQGLLWAFNSLYIMVNDQQIENSGLYRVMDTDGNRTLDTAQFLQQLDGWGEHGPHAVIQGPDGMIYVIAGNHTELPKKYTSRAPDVWNEDRLFESIKDPNGHAQEIRAPGGWIARTDSIGSFWEVISSGYRNAYDMDFNKDGELFTFDSDMEWDLGLPWYRPVRICHVTSGSEYGWRTGSGKWPEYYPDNLPGVVDIGQGSPTGVVAAMKSTFPDPYNQGLFVNDWSFGTMYHVTLEKKGSSYSGIVSEFLSGVPLPLTDVTFGDDGAMYFTTGGRRLSSGLYRVWSERNVTTKHRAEVTEEIKIRRQLEMNHQQKVSPDTSFIWDKLGHPDRFIRFAARIAMEKQGIEMWTRDFEQDADPNRMIEFGIAAARTGSGSLKQKVYQRLSGIKVEELTDMTKLGLIRAQGLLIVRHVGLDPAIISPQWQQEFPSSNPFVNEELAYLFATSEEPVWFNKLFQLWQNADGNERTIMIPEEVASRHDGYGEAIINTRKRTPNAHKIALMDALSGYETGWTDETRENFFHGFNSFWDREGGNSYRGFLTAILDKTLSSLSEEKAADYRKIAGTQLGEYGKAILADLPVPEGPGRNWTVEEVEHVMTKGILDPDFENGVRMFDAALCRTCHTMNNGGSSMGPDLTQLGTRFSVRDIAVSLIDPNREVSDQYMVSEFELQNGSQFSGKVTREVNDTLYIMTNPLLPDDLRKVSIMDLKAETKSIQSLMFPALLNRLNEQEVYDLMTYLLAGGDENHALFD